MKLPAFLLAAALAAPGVLAQATQPPPRPSGLGPAPERPAESAPEEEAETQVGPGGAVLRGLDKVAGVSRDIVIGPGESVNFGRLTITLTECRQPAGDPAQDAFAHLVIHDSLRADVVFRGWMIASSPALNALDHPRFDVWLIRCTSA